MRIPRLLTWFCVWFLLPGCSTHAATPAGKGRRPGAPETDVLLKAMVDELNRSASKLKLENLEKPYFIEYFTWDSHTFDVQATFGALTRAEQADHRPFRVNVRVGSYEQDNSRFMDFKTSRAIYRNMGQYILAENNYDALRHDLWLMTDAAYKLALEQLAGKRAYLENKVQPEKIDDFSREEPVLHLAGRIGPDYEADRWKDSVRRLSAIFREFPAIQDSQVRLLAAFSNNYLVTSEGSRVRQPESLVLLLARAFTQAPDGMRLKHHVTFFSKGLEQLPGEKEMAAAIRKMALELTALREAPVLESYTGPVLVSADAAGDLLLRLLVPNLLGNRRILGAPMGRMASRSGENRLNRRLLPAFFSVVDDPTRSKAGNEPLMGTHRFDDEGVSARPVKLIEKGVVVNLLTSRTPIKDINRSNGHGRRGTPGVVLPRISNLFVQPEKKSTYPQLKKRLIDLCKDQGLSHGLIVKKLDNPDITGWDRESYGFGRGHSTVSPPILAYRVAMDGSEELVRGLIFAEVSLRMLKDILAASDEQGAIHRSVSTGTALGRSSMLSRWMTPVAPVSVVAPSMLFEELELKRSEATQKKPVLLKHPYF